MFTISPNCCCTSLDMDRKQSEMNSVRLSGRPHLGEERLTDSLTNCYKIEKRETPVKCLHQSPANRREIEEVTNLILIIELSK